jgi:hypothetical protein
MMEEHIKNEHEPYINVIGAPKKKARKALYIILGSAVITGILGAR